MKRTKKLLALMLAAALALSSAAPAFGEESKDRKDDQKVQTEQQENKQDGQTQQRGVLTYSESIKPQYEAAEDFNDGLAAVKKDGKWGYISEKNDQAIPFQYDLAYTFHEGYAIVGTETTYEDWDGENRKAYDFGFIDPKGKYTPFTMQNYDGTGSEPYAVSEDVLSECFKPGGFFFHNGYVVLPSDINENFSRLYDTRGKYVESLSGSDAWMIPNGPFNEGLCPAFEEATAKAGYFDKNGKSVLSFDFDDWEKPYISGVLPFNQGLAPAYLYDPQTDTSKIGFLNKRGEWAIQPQFSNYFYSGVDAAYEMFGETGYAVMSDQNNLYGAIDKNGNWVITPKYEELWPYREGLAQFKSGGKYGYIDEKETVVIPAAYEKASSFNQGYAIVYDGTKAFMIDAKGNAIPGADKIDHNVYFKESSDGSQSIRTPDDYIVITDNGLYGFGHITYEKPLPEKSEMSSWAYEEVTAAIQADLVPTELQNLYLNNINRQEFCKLMVQAIEQITKKDIADIVQEKTKKSLNDTLHTYPFNDVSDNDVIACYALGIVSGRGNQTFDPYTSITREEAAAFLTRGAKVLGMDTDNVKEAGFTDGETVAVYFKDAVNFVYQLNIMSGTGKSNFTPKGNYTREQSYMTIYRLFQAAAGASAV